MSLNCGACSQRLQNLIEALSTGRISFSGDILVFPVGAGQVTFFIDRFKVIRQVFAEGWDLKNADRFPKLLRQAFARLGDAYVGGDYWILKEGLPIWRSLFSDLIEEGQAQVFVRVSHGRL